MGSPSLMIIEPTKRVTIVDKIGMLGAQKSTCLCYPFTKRIFLSGATVGLFTGLSLISLVELAFWVSRMVIDAVRVASGRPTWADQAEVIV